MTTVDRPDMMWPHVVKIHANKMIDGQLAEVSIAVTVEFIDDVAGPLMRYLTPQIDAAFDRLAQ